MKWNKMRNISQIILYTEANRKVRQITAIASDDKLTINETGVSSFDLTEFISPNGDYETTYDRTYSNEISDFKAADGKNYAKNKLKSGWVISIGSLVFLDTVDATNFITFLANAPNGAHNAFRMYIKKFGGSGEYYETFPTMNDDQLDLVDDGGDPEDDQQFRKWILVHVSNLTVTEEDVTIVDVEFTETASLV